MSINLRQYQQEAIDFLREREKHSLRGWLGKPHHTWLWAMRIPVAERWNKINPQLLQDLTGKSVLDLGCGFGMYWPLLAEKGARKFVGIDLFDKRNKWWKREGYYRAAKKFVKHFCPGCDINLIQDDVRNIDKYGLEKFDVIIAYAVISAKYKGIPKELFEEICNKYGREGTIKIYV